MNTAGALNVLSKCSTLLRNDTGTMASGLFIFLVSLGGFSITMEAHPWVYL